MAKTIAEQQSLINAGNKMGLSNTIMRDYGIPLDSSSVVSGDKEDVVDYATNNNKAYIGQVIAAKNSSEIELFVINNTVEEETNPVLTRLVRDSDLQAKIEELDSRTNPISQDHFITGITITDGKITSTGQASNVVSANKTNISLLQQADLTSDESAGVKGIYINTTSLTLNNKNGNTVQSGYNNTANLIDNFTGIRVHRGGDAAYMGVTSTGALQTVFYNGGSAAQGFAGTFLFKSYEQGDPHFNTTYTTSLSSNGSNINVSASLDLRSTAHANFFNSSSHPEVYICALDEGGMLSVGSTSVQAGNNTGTIILDGQSSTITSTNITTSNITTSNIQPETDINCTHINRKEMFIDAQIEVHNGGSIELCKNVSDSQVRSIYLNTNTGQIVTDSLLANSYVNTPVLRYHSKDYLTLTPSSHSDGDLVTIGANGTVWIKAGENDAGLSITDYNDEKIYLTADGGVEVKGKGISAPTFTATSDARLKKNITPYTSYKQGSILDLPIYKFDFINNGSKNNIGCLAQDLRKICPEIVHEDKDGYLSIEESKLVYLLLEEIKCLRNALTSLKN